MAVKSPEQIALETKIFNLYPIYCNEPNTAEQKKHEMELITLIYLRCKKYINKFKKAGTFNKDFKYKFFEEMSWEITEKAIDFLKLKYAQNNLKLNQVEFFYKLDYIIGQAIPEYFRTETQSVIDLPENINELLYKINKHIEMAEIKERKILSEYEKEILITEELGLCSKEKYHKIINASSAVNIDTPIIDDDYEILNISDPLTYNKFVKNESTSSPETDLLNMEAIEAEKEAISNVLNKQKKKDKNYLRALCTWYYAKNDEVWKNNYQNLFPIIDENLIAGFKEQYQIYFKYHPGKKDIKKANDNCSQDKKRIMVKIEAYKNNKENEVKNVNSCNS